VAKAEADKADMSNFRFNPSSAVNTAKRVLAPAKPDDPKKPIAEAEEKSE
jgi:hypothetical protein